MDVYIVKTGRSKDIHLGLKVDHNNVRDSTIIM